MTASDATPDLDVYDVACLAGGLQRVVETALVALAESGRVRVQAPGELAAVGLARRHPVEAAVLDAVGPQGHRSVETIRWRLTDDDRLLGIGRRLAAAGLVRGRRLHGRGDRSTWVATRAGRRTMRAVSEVPPADSVAGGTAAMQVALQGRDAMPDRALRAAIFEPPPAPPVGGRDIRRRRRELDLRDAYRGAHDLRGVVGGVAAIGFLEGGAGDGGGF